MQCFDYRRSLSLPLSLSLSFFFFLFLFFFFFNDTATTEIYTLSLHDALPIWSWWTTDRLRVDKGVALLANDANTSGLLSDDALIGWTLEDVSLRYADGQDRKSTRLNSSHLGISYAVFCLKKKKKKKPKKKKKKPKKKKKKTHLAQ